jgi:hypothetical protein
MKQILCLDFGTSSLRAALLRTDGQHTVLPIGASVQSELDNASIRSDILVRQDGKSICIAENAIKARIANDFMLYESSPKMWLKTPDNLDKPISANTDITREMLLILIIGYALRACIKAGQLSVDEFNRADIRVSHPIWPQSVSKVINERLVLIITCAIQIAPQLKGGVVITKKFLEQIASLKPTSSLHALSFEDVQEPIAAALTLIPNVDNTPRICAVIDIGAGTTDIGIFQSIYPDSLSDKPRSLIPVGGAISLFTAGNTIDQALLKLIQSKTSKSTHIEIENTKNKIRQLKESLFKDGVIKELGATVYLKELIESREIIGMCSDVRAALQGLLSNPDTYDTLSKFYKLRRIDYLDVVVGGGGSALKFIATSLSAQPFKFGNEEMLVKIIPPKSCQTIPTYGASIERLAVSVGGSDFEYERLRTKYSEPRHRMMGGM